MMRKLKSLLTGLALLTLVGLLSSSEAQEAAWAQQPLQIKLPPEMIDAIAKGQCPCPNPRYCPREVDPATFRFPRGDKAYRLEWWCESPSRYSLAWYNETTAAAYNLKAVGQHTTSGAITFKLPAFDNVNSLQMVNHDARPGMLGGIYYTNPALNLGGVKRAKVFPLVNWLPGGWIICWEVDPLIDWNDQIDWLAYPVGP